MDRSRDDVVMVVEIEPDARAFIAEHRVARLATADPQGAPHVVPICYAFDGRRIYTALDLKPKRVSPRSLKRVRNVKANPRVALVTDDYSEDWFRLAYVLIRGSAHVLEGGEERSRAEAMLREKYPQYETVLERGCTVLRITPEAVVGWGLGVGAGG